MDQTLSFCTIISKNYLAQARALAASVREHHPESRFFLLLVDRVDGHFDPAAEPFEMILVESLAIPSFPQFSFQYDILELNTAVKPYFLEHLFGHFAVEKLIYLDPDILVFHELGEIGRILESHSVVLTPHLDAPYNDGGHPDELTILRAGTFNLGFIALKKGPVAKQLLGWWKERLYLGCLMDPDRGYHVDQKWIDLAVGYFDGVHILRDPGYNVAYWNLHSRRIELREGKPFVGSSPCYFFHYSGFNPLSPKNISRHQSRLTMETIGDARVLYARYVDELVRQGLHLVRKWPYAFGSYDNGEPISAETRRKYLKRAAERRLVNPYHAKSPARSVEAAGKASFGVNLCGYLKSEKGAGEAARSMARALSAAGIPFALNCLSEPSSKDEDATFSKFSSDNPYPINLVHLGPDLVDVLLHKHPTYFAGRWNIGYWLWELPEFPQGWENAFYFFDEIWTSSTFSRDAIAKVSPVPVRTVPLAIEVPRLPSREVTRASFQLPEDRFLFLLAFDFHSQIERKNPLAVIQAFRKAFGADSRAMLVIKTSRASASPQASSRLHAACEDLPNVRWIDGVWSRERMNDLTGLCDACVSLHRSEGFGLVMAEAMAMGKPVIATGYSSNTDFMNQENSLLVKYRLTEITEDHGPYRAGNTWAEPNVEDAAERMRAVFDDPELARELGARASEDIETRLSPQRVGKLVKEILVETGARLSIHVPSEVRGDPEAISELAQWEDMSHLPVLSHRPWVGWMVNGIRRLLILLLFPTFNRQTRTNAKSRELLRAISARLREQQDAAAALAERLAQLESRRKNSDAS